MWPSDAIWVLEILINNGSGKGLLPDGTKPLPEPKLTCHQWSLVALTWQQFNCSRYRFIRMSLKIALLRLYPHLTEDNIRPCNLVNYTVEVHNKTIHFFLSVSHSYIHTHMPALHHCHCRYRQMDWSHLLTPSRSQNQRGQGRCMSDSLSDLSEFELSESEKEFLDHFGSGPSGNDKTRC